MPYARTVIIHDAGYVVPSASIEYERSTRPIDRGSTQVERTLIEFNDDGGPVPNGNGSAIHDRYDEPVDAGEANRQTIIRERMDSALSDLQLILDAGSSTQQEKGLARILRGLVRLSVPGYLDAVD